MGYTHAGGQCQRLLDSYNPTLGALSPIHLLAIFTLAMLPIAVLHARRHRVHQHRIAMLSLFFGALVIAGLFTLFPGRIMHTVVIGQ